MIDGVKLNARRMENITLIDVQGFLDNSNVEGFEHRLFDLFPPAPANVVLNLDRLEYICSAGLAVLLAAQDQLHKNRGEVMLLNVPPQIEHLFRTLGFQEFFRLLRNEQEALRLFSAPGRAE